MEDNRTFWELSFTETGLTEAQKRAAALEEGFKKIRDAANAAAVNTGNNFVQLLQPMDAAKQRKWWHSVPPSRPISCPANVKMRC